jgi:hypothetical protein
VARTPIMGLREDVAIRVVPDGDGSRIDIRSSSRHFESDLGSNAARIAKLITDLNTISDENSAPTKRPQTPMPPAKTQAKGTKK